MHNPRLPNKSTKEIMPSSWHLRMNLVQDIVQNMKPLCQQRNIMALVRQMKTLQSVASPYGKTFPCYFATKMQKRMMTLKNRHIQICDPEMNR